jgi:hypothetical protein
MLEQWSVQRMAHYYLAGLHSCMLDYLGNHCQPRAVELVVGVVVVVVAAVGAAADVLADVVVDEELDVLAVVKPGEAVAVFAVGAAGATVPAPDD